MSLPYYRAMRHCNSLKLLPPRHTSLSSNDFTELLGLQHLTDTIVCRDISTVTRRIRDISQRAYDSSCGNHPPAMMFVADFDYTLTMPGGLTSWSVIDSHPLTPAPIRQSCVDLAVKYYPVEASLALTEEQKRPLMDAWFLSYHELLRSTNFSEERTRDLVRTCLTEPEHSASVLTQQKSLKPLIEDEENRASEQVKQPSRWCGSVSAYWREMERMHVREPYHPPNGAEHPTAANKYLYMRRGYADLAWRLWRQRVPQVVVSAGQGLPIASALEHYLNPRTSDSADGVTLQAEQKNEETDATLSRQPRLRVRALRDQSVDAAALEDILVCANWCVYEGEDSTVNRPVAHYPPQPIHVYSKDRVPELSAAQAVVARRAEAHGWSDTRVDVVLAGDSLGDLTIEGSLPHTRECLRVGLLNVPPHLHAHMLTMQLAGRSQRNSLIGGPANAPAQPAVDRGAGVVITEELMEEVVFNDVSGGSSICVTEEVSYSARERVSGAFNKDNGVAEERLTAESQCVNWRNIDDDRIFCLPHSEECLAMKRDNIDVLKHVGHPGTFDLSALPEETRPRTMGDVLSLYEGAKCQGCELDKWRARLLAFTRKFDIVVLGTGSVVELDHIFSTILVTDSATTTDKNFFNCTVINDKVVLKSEATFLRPTATGFAKFKVTTLASSSKE